MDVFTRIWGKKHRWKNDGTENKRADDLKSLFNKHSWDAAEVRRWGSYLFKLTKKICLR